MELYKIENDILKEQMEDMTEENVKEEKTVLRNPIKPLLFMHINKYCTEKVYGKDENQNSSYKYKKIKKFHYPLVFDVGQQPIGLFETLYNQKSKYIYIPCKSSDYPDARRCNCFFIRKKNWCSIFNELNEDET